MRIITSAVAALLACMPIAAQADSLEQGVLEQINFARAHPQEFADRLRNYAASFDGIVAHENGDPVGVMTHEGAPAVEEAISFLERQAPLPPLSEGDLLALAAEDHVAEQGPSGGIGHVTAGRNPGDRVRARGGDIYVGETISYGEATPESVVRQFIVDDGEPRRGHRTLLFSKSYRFAGVGCGDHATFGAMCVVDYAATANGSPVVPGYALASAR